MTPRQMWMAAGIVLAGGLFVFGDRTPASGLAEAVTRSKAPAPLPATLAGGATVKATPVILALQARPRLSTQAGQVEPGSATGLFAVRDWTPLPVAPVAPRPLPPEPPPLPFTVIGKASSDGIWEVFLASADQTYVVRAHTVINDLYRVESIAPPLLVITFLPLNRRQQIHIGVSE